MPDLIVQEPPAAPGRFARLWEAGWIGSPTGGAAWARCLALLVYTVVAVAATTALWSTATFSGPLAVLDVVPPVLAASIGLVAVLYWLHGSAGQSFLYLFAVLLAVLVGGFAVRDAVFQFRGVVSRAVITDCVQRDDARDQWQECRVRLSNGARPPGSLRAEPGEVHAGERVTVTYDPGGIVAPAFGDQSDRGAGLTDTAAGGLAVALLCVVAATWTGERLRTSGRAGIAQQPNPGYYPRRIAHQRRRAEARRAAN